ncbi:MAG TPA: hypothetical protein VFE17_11410 [Candidatus Baltobacteraceae bacterium]|jgi:hypothetical protein|nr:hypothetical protein [Candidatus Baltobacteraceae bacterium]
MAELDLAAADLYITLSEYHAGYEHALGALKEYERGADERRAAEAGWALGRSCVFIGLAADGDMHLTKALERARRLRLPKINCWIFPAMAQRRIDDGELDAAERLEEQALELAWQISFG